MGVSLNCAPLLHSVVLLTLMSLLCLVVACAIVEGTSEYSWAHRRSTPLLESVSIHHSGIRDLVPSFFMTDSKIEFCHPLPIPPSPVQPITMMASGLLVLAFKQTQAVPNRAKQQVRFNAPPSRQHRPCLSSSAAEERGIFGILAFCPAWEKYRQVLLQIKRTGWRQEGALQGYTVFALFLQHWLIQLNTRKRRLPSIPVTALYCGCG